MAQGKLVATMGTSAATDGNQVGIFTVQAKHFNKGMKPTITIDGLAGSETCDLYIYAGGDWKVEGTQFAVDTETKVMNGPGEFGFVKSSTAASLEVRLNDGRG